MNADKLSTRCTTENWTIPTNADMSPKQMIWDISGISTYRSRRLHSNINNPDQLRSLNGKFLSIVSSLVYYLGKNEHNKQNSLYNSDSMSITYTQQNRSLHKNLMCNTLNGESIFSNEETKCLDEIGKCKECFHKVLNKLTKQKQNSISRLNQEKAESLNRIRSISNQMCFNNKFHGASFKISSRNESSLMSSKSPKLKHRKSKKVVTAQMIAHRGTKSRDEMKLEEKFHSVDPNIKVLYQIFEVIIEYSMIKRN